MSLNPATVFYQFPNLPPYFDEDEAVLQLFQEGILFSHEQNGNTGLSVNSNDVFMWGCADADDLPYDKIESLYRLVLAHGEAGKEKWLCIQRNSKPQVCVARDMKTAGAWDEQMEALPENDYDIWCREQAAKREKEK